ncbi:hypothetical protein CDO28_21890 (plasmid) [Sinorhizobium meliloti]|nr:hypothetical protein CDO28_21890 [Sinorhizobium meliloti]
MTIWPGDLLEFVAGDDPAAFQSFDANETPPCNTLYALYFPKGISGAYRHSWLLISVALADVRLSSDGRGNSGTVRRRDFY